MDLCLVGFFVTCWYYWCRRRDSNPHALKERGILSSSEPRCHWWSFVANGWNLATWRGYRGVIKTDDYRWFRFIRGQNGHSPGTGARDMPARSSCLARDVKPFHIRPHALSEFLTATKPLQLDLQDLQLVTCPTERRNPFRFSLYLEGT